MSQNLETFGKYILLEKLAMGGMAEIYLAKHSGASGVSKFVAIKRILPQFTEQTEFIDMFKDEAKIAVNLSHANVVSIFEFGLEKNCFFLAMDYIEGRNLRQILNKMKKSSLSFSIEQVLYIIKEVAGGLDHAHRCIDAQTGKPLNIIHRDMSPQNVMISFEGEVKIVDFGIAKAETQLETTRAGTLKGKFGYMSPEQAEGQPVDLRTDVFALGIVLWELLANDRLFVANNEVNTLRKIRDCQVPSLRKINPNIPPELERIVGKALAKDRNLRYQTAAAFHRELSRFLNRQFPDFSPQDFSVFIKTLFAGEILESRKKNIEFAKIDHTKLEQQQLLQNPQPPPAITQPTNPPEKTVITATGTEMESGSDSAIDFGNPGHLKKAAQQAPPPQTATGQQQPSNAAPLPANFSSQWKAPPQPSTGSIVPAEGLPPQPRTPPGMRRNDTGLQFDQRSYIGAVREGTSVGTRTTSRSYSTPSSNPVSALVLMIFIGLAIGGGTYYIQNPLKVKSWVADMGNKYGFNTGLTVEPPPLVATNTSSVTPIHEIVITSFPSGAPIEIDGRPTGDVTPTSVRAPEGKEITVSIRLAGYLPVPGSPGAGSPDGSFKQTIRVDGPRTIEAKFKSDKKGFLNIVVKGEGQIFINNKLVASTSPARMISVPADEPISVSTYDQRTNTSDQVVTTVGEGATRNITLTPRAPASSQKQ